MCYKLVKSKVTPNCSATDRKKVVEIICKDYYQKFY